MGLIKACRPHQWIKNVFVLFPLIVLINESMREKIEASGQIAILFVAFSLAASSVYIINDISDKEKDRRHPSKKNRVIASGKVDVRTAAIFAVVLGTISLTLAFLLGSFALLGILLIYLFLSHTYTFRLKHIPIVDVLTVGSLYGLRVAGGFITLMVFPSSWIWWVASATCLACAIELGKRKSEVQVVKADTDTRNTLAYYARKNMLLVLYRVTSSASCCVYIVAVLLISPTLVITSPLVLAGTWRFWQRIELLTEDQHPQTVILGDRVMLGILGAFVLLLGASFTASIARTMI